MVSLSAPYPPPQVSKRLSEPVRDILYNCLRLEPESRPTCTMLIQHQWFAVMTSADPSFLDAAAASAQRSSGLQAGLRSPRWCLQAAATFTTIGSHDEIPHEDSHSTARPPRPQSCLGPNARYPRRPESRRCLRQSKSTSEALHSQSLGTAGSALESPRAAPPRHLMKSRSMPNCTQEDPPSAVPDAPDAPALASHTLPVLTIFDLPTAMTASPRPDLPSYRSVPSFRRAFGPVIDRVLCGGALETSTPDANLPQGAQLGSAETPGLSSGDASTALYTIPESGSIIGVHGCSSSPQCALPGMLTFASTDPSGPDDVRGAMTAPVSAKYTPTSDSWNSFRDSLSQEPSN